ncbi:hypothetical protein KZX45_06700 [Georgenia sp. EYE_87]|uniref:hypothetical protein n=1 Tax=Georgenia sp. EYE_87 TaxID=2853448 RepID=UPI0020052900|nr:hypothetical protein [Georgenia sp. EYE_87]MCK6210232.1 hypothetical protein [Georgenia sp. EYE_87]
MTRQLASRLGAGLLAALVLALLAGGLARVLMRLLVVLSGEEGRFSVAGTLGILAVFAATMTPGAVAAALGARRTSWVLLALGAAVLLLQSVVIPLQEDRTALADAGGLLQGVTVVVLAAFPVVIVAQAMATSRLAAALARRLGPGHRGRERAAVGG